MGPEGAMGSEGEGSGLFHVRWVFSSLLKASSLEPFHLFLRQRSFFSQLNAVATLVSAVDMERVSSTKAAQLHQGLGVRVGSTALAERKPITLPPLKSLLSDRLSEKRVSFKIQESQICQS